MLLLTKFLGQRENRPFMTSAIPWERILTQRTCTNQSTARTHQHSKIVDPSAVNSASTISWRRCLQPTLPTMVLKIAVNFILQYLSCLKKISTWDVKEPTHYSKEPCRVLDDVDVDETSWPYLSFQKIMRMLSDRDYDNSDETDETEFYSLGLLYFSSGHPTF